MALLYRLIENSLEPFYMRLTAENTNNCKNQLFLYHIKTR